MSQTSDITSPCSRLNDDVFREIFIHCIIHPGNYCYTDCYSQNISTRFMVSSYSKVSIRKQPQLSVSQTCSSWRNITLHTPQLWDNIRIANLTEANLSTAREYLSRAGNLPIYITIGGWPPSTHSQLTDFLSSYRIRILNVIESRMPRFDLVLSNLPLRSVAELESLMIESHTGHLDPEEQIDLNDTRYPKLAVVHIRGPGVYKIPSFNISSLRIFDSTRLSVTVIEAWDLLSRCPSLEESRLWITQVNWSPRPVSMPQINHQCLRILELDSNEKSGLPFSTFIEALSLPVLEELYLGGRASVVWSATAFQSLSYRSNYFPHLNTFSLDDATSVVNIPTLLASMPWLKSICLCPYDNINKTVSFDHLALSGLASGSLTPWLQSLRVGTIDILNTGPFLDMVKSRTENAQISSNGVPALFTEVVFSSSKYGYDSMLDDMRQQGIPLSCSVSHLPSRSDCSKMIREFIRIDTFQVR